jgi:hypothetical protein
MPGGPRSISFVLVLVLAGCGSGALTAPSDTVVTTTADDTTAADTATDQTKTTTTTTTKRQYGWYLPEGPTSPTTNEDVLYRRLLAKACDEAQQELDRTWSGLQTPRNAPLYQAAVDLCDGDASGARAMLAKATALGLQVHRGPGGSASVDCAVLKAVRSVVDQVAQESVRCTPGTPPRWPTDDPSAKDDPRTDVVEGTTTTTDEPTTTTSSTEEPTTTTAPST